MDDKKLSIFISGVIDLPKEKFDKYYVPILTSILKEHPNTNVYVSDDQGVSLYVQNFFVEHELKLNNLCIFCIGDFPRVRQSKSFKFIGGFRTIEERNAAMTATSDMDLHIIIDGKNVEDIKQNLVRRNMVEYDFSQYLSDKYNKPFWELFAIS